MSEHKYAGIDFHVDRYRLLDQCEEQPAAVMEFAMRQAEVSGEIEDLKIEMTLLASEIGESVRAAPVRYGLEKVTEGAVKEIVSKDKKYQKKQARMQELNHDYGVIGAALKALEHRKKMLEILANGKLAGWYGEVKPSKDARKGRKSTTITRPGDDRPGDDDDSE